jgi:predicted ATPase
LLLLLDNFEHLLEAVPVVSDVVRNRPGLTVLATSRAPLRISGERHYPLLPLSLVAGASLERSPAVRLFEERAREVSPGFEIDAGNEAAVAEICRRLDGLPLAIELAAAKIKLFSPKALLDRLELRLPLLSGGARDLPERQQTLRDTVAWSYGLLGPAERALFGRLAVFAGGFSLEAAEAVCGPGMPEGKKVLAERSFRPSVARITTTPRTQPARPSDTGLSTRRGPLVTRCPWKRSSRRLLAKRGNLHHRSIPG